MMEDQADHSVDEIHEDVATMSTPSGSSSGHAETEAKRKLVRHTVDQKKILRGYYMKGMNNGRVKHLVEEAAAKTGLKISQVMSWINSQNKLARIRSGEAVRRKNISINPRPATKQTARYRLFMSDYMTGKSHASEEERRKVLQKAGKAWIKASKKKEEIKKLDSRIAKRPQMSINDLTNNQKRHRAAKIVKKIKGYCRQLDKELGYTTTVMSSHPQQGTMYTGNKFGRQYVETNEFFNLRRFHFANGAQDFNLPKGDKQRKDVKKIRSKLRKRLNEKFCAVTGSSQVAYQAIRQKTIPIEVQGWPQNVGFQNPSNFGEAKLRQLLAAVDSIEFVRKDRGENMDKNERSGESDSSGESSADENEDIMSNGNSGSGGEGESEEESSEDIAELRRMVKSKDGEELFIVEKIVRCIKKKGEPTLYEVKWRGWDSNTNTFETEDTLKNNVVFQEFKRKVDKKGGKRKLKVTKY